MQDIRTDYVPIGPLQGGRASDDLTISILCVYIVETTAKSGDTWRGTLNAYRTVRRSICACVRAVVKSEAAKFHRVGHRDMCEASPPVEN